MVRPLGNRQYAGRASGGGQGGADSTPAREAQDRRREHSVTVFVYTNVVHPRSDWLCVDNRVWPAAPTCPHGVSTTNSWARSSGSGSGAVTGAARLEDAAPLTDRGRGHPGSGASVGTGSPQHLLTSCLCVTFGDSHHF